MLKGKKLVLEFETYEKEATLNTLVSAETKPKKKKKNSGFWVTTSCTLERLCTHEFSLHA